MAKKLLFMPIINYQNKMKQINNVWSNYGFTLKKKKLN